MNSTSSAHPPPDSDGPSRPRWSRVAIVGAAALVCGAFTAGPALAEGDSSGGRPIAVELADQQRHDAGGTINAVGATSFELAQRDGSPLTVMTTDATSITMRTPATLADVTPGSYVVARYGPAEDGTLTATRIEIRPAPADSDASSKAWHKWRSWQSGVAGVVESTDLTHGVVTLTTDNGLLSLVVNDGTSIKQTTNLTVGALPVGALVAVKGMVTSDGAFTATHVRVFSATASPPVEEAPLAIQPPPSTVEAAADSSTGDDGEGDDSSPSNSRYHGAVTAVDGTTFALTLRDGTVLTVITNEDTEFRNKLSDHSRGDRTGDDERAPSSISDVAVGAWVKVKGAVVDGNVLLAEKVTVGPLQVHDDGSWNAGRHSDRRENGDDQSGRGNDDARERGGRGNGRGHDRGQSAGSRGGGRR